MSSRHSPDATEVMLHTEAELEVAACGWAGTCCTTHMPQTTPCHTPTTRVKLQDWRLAIAAVFVAARICLSHLPAKRYS